jgi:hypothetical protein
MKISIDPVITSRIKAAWNKLSSDQRGQLAPLILSANQQAVTVTQTGMAPTDPAAAHYLVLAHSVLSGDSDGVAASLEAGVVVTVGPDGVIWGTGKYQQFDPGWTEALAVYLETIALGGKHAFIAIPQTIPIPDDVQIGLVGDWGTGDWRPAPNLAPSTDVGSHLALLEPEITIHLGDVYYAGTSDQEQHLLVNIWPEGSLGSLALSSNHEMYSGAKPYFDAITDPNGPFAIQKGCSYFALENTNWVIVGLDSAYFSPEAGLYMDGLLGPNEGTQVMFLQQQVAKGKKVIVLTHHNGLAQDGSTTTALWAQVMSGFPEGAGPAYWYWGHAHAGVVYQPKPPHAGALATVLCRCCGHGALPWGHATELDNNPNVLWYENRPARDPDIRQRVLNGFAVLYLDGPNIQEVFYDENGGGAWRST